MVEDEFGDERDKAQRVLLKLARMRMPFGRYKGRILVDLPEPYVVWFHRKGYPRGEVGDLLRSLYEIKANGLEHLVRPLKLDPDAHGGDPQTILR